MLDTIHIPHTHNGDTTPEQRPTASDTARRAAKQRVSDNKLSKRLLRETGRAISDFNMIEEGDKVMVCLSGGKDSYGLLDVLLTLQARSPVKFELVAVNLDQKQPGFPDHVLPDYLRGLNVPFHIETQDTYSVVTRVIAEGKTMCSLCSRLRRGILYRVADELGATKIALGHHRDDILATFFLNLYYGGRMKAMPPKLMSDDGKHIVIRPLAYVAEKDLIAYAQLKQFPIIPCNLCGTQENLKRQEIGRMIAEVLTVSQLNRLARELECGTVSINHFAGAGFDTPFGGMKDSGWGREGGAECFDGYLTTKLVSQRCR